MKQVAADCHHYKEHRIFMKKGEWHFLPMEIIVHFIKQAFAFAPIIVEPYNFNIGHLPVIMQNFYQDS